MDDFMSDSIAHGFSYQEFSNLDEVVKKKLLKLMSRISEQSFRRGFQHGKEFEKEGRSTVDPSILRFETTLDLSPYTDAFDEKGRWVKTRGPASIDRLFMECGVLNHLFY